jgi:hypothetical protein
MRFSFFWKLREACYLVTNVSNNVDKIPIIVAMVSPEDSKAFLEELICNVHNAMMR